MWLPGVNGKFSAGPFDKSVDASFIDIAGKLRNFPLAFMGRFEAHYERLGFYLDGNYMDLDFINTDVTMSGPFLGLTGYYLATLEHPMEGNLSSCLPRLSTCGYTGSLTLFTPLNP
jgi:hypothetical protein